MKSGFLTSIWSGEAPRKEGEGLFALDFRALAALRIGLGLLVIFDLIWRAGDYAVHYADDGVFPVAALAEEYLRPGRFCLHAFLDGWPELILWLIQGVAAFCMVIGYRTRTAMVITLLLLLSLHARNFMVLQSGDVALRVFMFWGIFAPLGARWSVDSALRGSVPETKRVRSVATMAIILQLVMIYAFAIICKLGQPIWWEERAAVYYALSVREFTTGLGYWMRDWPPLMLEMATYATLIVQATAVIALLTPRGNEKLRSQLAAVMIPMHVVYMLTLSIGLFSYIMCTIWLAEGVTVAIRRSRVGQNNGSETPNHFVRCELRRAQ